MMDQAIVIRDEVREGLKQGVGIVALETAVLTHGLPYPENLETMAAMSDAVRTAGAIPAVIGVRQGELVVGLRSGEWEDLLFEAEKCSIRDLGVVIAGRKNGGTTVAATAYAAHQAGIRVFATGGIGGVHRGASDTWDVSADLKAVASLPVVIVSSGAKSILDLPKTVEFLESLGIPIIGYRTRELPGFYVSRTGLPVSSSVQQVDEAVTIERAMRAIGLRQALLLVQPGPKDVDPAIVEKLITQALEEADRQSITGKAVTPFLLGYLNDQAGNSLKSANIALLKANARLAGEVAAKFHA